MGDLFACSLCAQGDQPPCIPCRATVTDLLREIPVLVRYLQEDLAQGGRVYPSHAPRVTGTRERPLPISVDTFDLLRTVEDALIVWCDAFAARADEEPPAHIVGAQCRWLRHRTNLAVFPYLRCLELLVKHLRQEAGVPEPKIDYKRGIPCPSRECGKVALFHIPGSPYVECGVCGRLYSDREYQDHIVHLLKIT